MEEATAKGPHERRPAKEGVTQRHFSGRGSGASSKLTVSSEAAHILFMYRGLETVRIWDLYSFTPREFPPIN